MPENARGTLDVLPNELWDKVTHFLKPADIQALKTASASIYATVEEIKGPVPPDKWKNKMAKWEALRKVVYQNSLEISNLNKELNRLPAIGPQHLQMVNQYLNESGTAAESGIKTLKEKVGKLKLRKVLTAEQEKELAEFQKKIEMAEITYQAQMKLVGKTLMEKLRREVKMKK
jgi:Na+/phosphate symporter